MKKYLPLLIIGIGLYIIYSDSKKSIKVDTKQRGDSDNPNMSGVRRRSFMINHQAV